MVETRTALVTGSMQGIGLAIARRLASQGNNLVLTGLAEEIGEGKAQAGIEADFGVEVMVCPADLASPDAIRHLVAEASGRFGPVDILVNNAAAPRPPVRVTGMGDDEWNLTVAVNLNAPFFLSRALLPSMLERRWGRIVNISSVFGLVGTANRPGYVATKHALIGLTRAIAAETQNSGVTCNAVCPGLTMTPRLQEAVAAIAKEQDVSLEKAETILARRLVAEKFLSAESVAAAVGYLCGENSGDTTGIALPIDGGQSAVC